MATITKRAGGWQAKIRRRGYPPQTATFDTKAQAERWAREIEAKMDGHAFIAITKEAERTTLKEVLERYKNERTAKKKSNGPEKSKIGILQKHKLAGRFLVSIRSTDIAALRDELDEQEYAANSIRLYLAILSNLFNVARREWGFEAVANPVELVEKPSTTGTARDRRLKEGELELLQEHATERWLFAIVELAVETAMRRSELVLLTWEQVDLEASIARLTKTKNGEDRDVPLTPRAREILQELHDQAAGKVKGATPIRKVEPAGRIFDVHPDNVSHAFYDTTVAAKIDDLRFHDLRHEATSRLVERGLHPREIMAITGHKTMQMLVRYSHPRAADLVRKLAA